MLFMLFLSFFEQLIVFAYSLAPSLSKFLFCQSVIFQLLFTLCSYQGSIVSLLSSKESFSFILSILFL